MIIYDLEAHDNFEIDNKEFKSLYFEISILDSNDNSELNIYADKILIFSIANPIQNIKSKHELPIFDCKKIYFELKNITCKFHFIELKENALKYLNSIFGSSKLEISYKCCDKLIFLIADENNADLLDICIKSMRHNANINSYNLAVININNSKQIESICKENSAFILNCQASDLERIFLAKGSIYKIPNCLIANEYIYLDVDILVTDNFTDTGYLDSNKIAFCSERFNSFTLYDFFESNKLMYCYEINRYRNCSYLYGQIDKQQEGSLTFLKKQIKQNLAINTGFIVSKRKPLLQLQSKLEQLDKYNIQYLSYKNNFLFREQACVNVAASHNCSIQLLPKNYNYLLIEESDTIRNYSIYNAINKKIVKILHFNGQRNKVLMREIIKTLKFEKRNDFKYDFEQLNI